MRDTTALRPLKAVGRTDELRKTLLGLCRSLGPEGRLPTVREMSSKLGVSLSTLDRVLDGLDREGVVTRRHGQGVFVAKDRVASVGLICGTNLLEPGTSPFYHLFADTARRQVEASKLRYKFYIDTRFDKHGAPANDELERDIDAGRIGGALFLAARHPEELAWLKDKGLPFVAFTDCPYAERRFYPDYPEMVRRGVAALASSGAKRLALIPYWDGGGELFLSCADAFRTALAHSRLKYSEDAVWRKETIGGVESNELAGARAVEELFGRRKGGRFDGIVSVDDMMTIGALHALRKIGLTPGKDVLVATHANLGSPSLDLFRSDVTMIPFDVEAIIRRMLGTLYKLMDGRAVAPFYELVKPIAEIKP